MPNITSPYNPIWYAQRFIERLERQLTFAPLMFRAYEESARRRGDTIEVRKPGGFTAENMPITTAADLTPTKFNITLANHKGVAFAITDKDLTFTGDEIIREHIDPAVQAVAEAIEDSCFGLYADVPWYLDADDTTPINDFINGKKAMTDRKVPLANRQYMMTTAKEAAYTSLSLFHQANTGADGAATQREGSLGRKFGFNNHISIGTPSHTPGALVGTPITNGIHAIRAETLLLDAVSLTGTVKAGDTLSIAGQTQRYAVTADSTAAGNAISVDIIPPLVAEVADGVEITVRQESKNIGLQFHREAFALVMAPLSEAGNGRGAEMGTAVDDQTGLTIRMSRFYLPKETENWIRFDALWGVKTLDPDKAQRIED